MDESQANIAIKALDETLIEKKRHITKLKTAIEAANSHKANLIFEWERLKARKQPAFWWVLILSLIILHGFAWLGKKYMIAIMCEYAFLVLWRGLYMKHTKYATSVAICVIAIGLYFL